MGVTQQEQSKVPNLNHDEDKYGNKMGAYAHYIINTFNKGKL